MTLERITTFSDDRVYRYTLWREFQDGDFLFDTSRESLGFVQFICLNPSTADETKDDPTIRRCIGFAKKWGYGAMCMTNLFAFRATLPKDMMAANDPIGSKNDNFLKSISNNASLVITAWGKGGTFNGRGILVCEMLRKAGINLKHLGLNSDWTPKHPLYLKSDTLPKDYE